MKKSICAELVQTGRTSASQAEGRVFKSRTPHCVKVKIFKIRISEKT